MNSNPIGRFTFSSCVPGIPRGAFFEEIHDALRTKIRRLVELDGVFAGRSANSETERCDRVERIAAGIAEIGRS